jgi:hypothetical protein
MNIVISKRVETKNITGNQKTLEEEKMVTRQSPCPRIIINANIY